MGFTYILMNQISYYCFPLKESLHGIYIRTSELNLLLLFSSQGIVAWDLYTSKLDLLLLFSFPGIAARDFPVSFSLKLHHGILLV
jgi:hypothetical protein